MDSKKILNFCLENGLLIDQELLELFKDEKDLDAIKLILEKIKVYSQTKIITKEVLRTNYEKVGQVLSDLPEQNQKSLEKLKIKLGLSIEISQERENFFKKQTFVEKPIVRILSKNLFTNRKLEVKDFVTYFRNRFYEMKNYLQEHSGLEDLVSINKISGNRQGISIIGIVYDKRVTKNKNIILEVEDMTGRIKVLISKNKEEVYKKAEDVALDSVLGFKCSGNREILFVNDIVFPDSVLFERKKALVEEYALFIGDIHYGSKNFMENNFLDFIDYLNGKVPNTPEVEKIKYVFIVGDLITGVGNYPNQERDLKIVDLEEQFSGIADLLCKIRKDIQIIISPGNHEGVRLMEPQPLFDEKYAWKLYDMENVILTENPCLINVGARSNFPGFNVLYYHGFSFPYYANNVSSLMTKKAMNTPEVIMKYLLKNRHLAPTHASVQYFPGQVDAHLIRKIPDIFVAGHTHKSAATYYNNILVISSSSWESMTPYQEKFGNEPDHCKVPMFNLKTRAIKILDFE